MEEMGHIAGLAASVIAAFATIGAVIIAAPVGLAFDGTPLPMALGELLFVVLALWLTTMIRRPGDA
jgi:DHA1 family bicyclomycin/chloramphenicol resistance-like MFS transporter